MIGTAAALLGTAAIGAIATSGSNKAANKAIAAQQQATNENNALTRQIYDQNYSVLSPFAQRGNEAGSAINALLGFGGGPAAATAPSNDNALLAHANIPSWKLPEGDNYLPYGSIPQQEGAATAATPASNTSQYQTAFDNFRNSTGYQFRLGEGMNALNTGYAAKGLLNSGAAQKAALNYGQNIASAEFGNYLGYLGNQQGVGLSAGSALAGVGQNYANAISANNNAAADAAGNGALIKSQNNNALLSSLTNVLGTGLGYSSYGRR